MHNELPHATNLITFCALSDNFANVSHSCGTFAVIAQNFTNAFKFHRMELRAA
jgi:hypothetical protein